MLWNINLLYHNNEDKRLSIAQNPHFYPSLTVLPNGTYQGTPMNDLAEPFPDTIYVLTDTKCRIYFDFGVYVGRRAFDHIWRTTEDTLGFRDITGRLESEATVEGSIPDSPLIWFCVKPPKFEPEEGGEIGKLGIWSDPILDQWDSSGTRIYIIKTKEEKERKRDHQGPGSSGEGFIEFVPGF